jgi:hypothetical protein
VEAAGLGASVPDGDHVVVHLLQLGLGRIERVGRRVELVRLKALIREADLKGLIVLLRAVSHPSRAIFRSIAPL